VIGAPVWASSQPYCPELFDSTAVLSAQPADPMAGAIEAGVEHELAGKPPGIGAEYSDIPAGQLPDDGVDWSVSFLREHHNRAGNGHSSSQS
jgi:hypothetical protein